LTEEGRQPSVFDCVFEIFQRLFTVGSQRSESARLFNYIPDLYARSADRANERQRKGLTPTNSPPTKNPGSFPSVLPFLLQILLASSSSDTSSLTNGIESVESVRIRYSCSVRCFAGKGRDVVWA
jgi:hypothetical protein